MSSLLASSRVIFNDRDDWVMSTGHGCPHLRLVPMAEADRHLRSFVRALISTWGDEPVEFKGSAEEFADAHRRVVGLQVIDDVIHVAVCDDPNCYPPPPDRA